MYTQLPKLRAKASFGLSREDLTLRSASANMQNIDFHAVAEKYSPHKYTAEQIPDIPVYNRETNKFRRISRIVSSPVMSMQALAASSQPANLAQFDKHEQADLSGPKPVRKDVEKDYKKVTKEMSEMRIEPSEHKVAPLSPPAVSKIHESINCRPSPPPKNGEQSRHSFERVRDLDNPELLLDTRKKAPEKHFPANQKQFPKFSPQYQPQFRTPSIKEHERQDLTLSTDMPATYASSCVSTFESHLSASSYASSETDLSSVESYEADIFSYYEKSGSTYQYEESLLDPPRASEDDSPPEPPKHEQKVSSDVFLSASRDSVPRNDTVKAKKSYIPFTLAHMMPSKQEKVFSRTRENSATIAQTVAQTIQKPRAPSNYVRSSSSAMHSSGVPAKAAHDFCLDFGADYKDSKFAIPREHQVRKPHRHIDQGFI